MKSSWLEIDCSGLAENIRALRKAIRPATEIIFVVKANAYGHGLAAIAEEAVHAGIRWFGVAHVLEALAVRRIAPDADILLMGAAGAEDAAALAQGRITAIVVSAAHGQALAQAAHADGLTLNAHLKIDTGMGRLGVAWGDARDAFAALQNLRGLCVTGVCSHFAMVEPSQPMRAEEQAARFMTLADDMETMRGDRLFKHISSSRAILYHPEWDVDAVRPGICLYGYGTSDPGMRFRTRPFLHWKCHVMQVKAVPADCPVGYYGTYVTHRPTRMAILSAGYADGYHRALSNRGHVLIRGRRCPVIGRVSMNWITVDLGPDGEADAGDEAVLIGEQQGTAVWAGELAKICRTIPYEILVGIDHAAPRRFINAASTNPR